MLQKTQKVIKCKIVDLTNKKSEDLGVEYSNLQKILQFESVGLDFLPLYENIELYSANKQQALRFYKKIKSDKEYALSIRKDLIKIEYQPNNTVSKYWCKIPNKHNRKLWVAIKPHIEDIDFSRCVLGESKLFRKMNRKGSFEWWIHITVIKEVEIKKSYSNILAIDLGSKVIATVCGSFDNKPMFYGREVGGIRRHYQYLRAELGKKHLSKKIRQMSDREQRTVNNVLHNVSRKIVDCAEKTDSYIVLGDLKGIRNSSGNKGRTFRRIVSNMPYLKLTQFIEYKANEKGIKVLRVSERNTSYSCSKCGYADKGNRKSQGLFKCESCGYEINADVNGVRNILSLGYTLKDRVLSEQAPNSI